jgi:plasmid stabilization system protein ParE
LEVLDGLAEAQARRISQTVKLLQTFPQIGVPVQYPGWSDLRRVLAGGWAVVYGYEAIEDRVTVYVLRPPRVGWRGEFG